MPRAATSGNGLAVRGSVPRSVAVSVAMFDPVDPAVVLVVVSPVVPGVVVPTGLPPCPSLRNEPCS